MIIYGNLKSSGSFESTGAFGRIWIIIWKPKIFWIIQIIWCTWEDLDDYIGKPKIFWIIRIIWCIWEDLDNYMET